MDKVNDQPVVTIVLCALAVIVVIAGAIVTIAAPKTLPFHDYVQDIAIALAGLGLGAGVGRGAIAAARSNGGGEPPSEPRA